MTNTLEAKQAAMRERIRAQREVQMTTGTKPPSAELALLRRFFFEAAPVPALIDASGRDILPESAEHETHAEEELCIDDPVHDIEAERARDILARACCPPPPQPVADVDAKLISFVFNSLKE